MGKTGARRLSLAFCFESSGIKVRPNIIWEELLETYKHNGYSVCRLGAGDGTASAEIVPELGAVVASLKLPWQGALREVLYQQPFFWDREVERTRGGLPLLFPVCGRMERDGVVGAYLYDGQMNQMRIHGFGMRIPWVVEAKTQDTLKVTLRDTEATRSEYPFEFRVTLTYKLAAGGLILEQEYENKGAKPMPYFAGFHPYFLTPPAGEGKESAILQLTALSRWKYNEKLTDIVGKTEAPLFPAALGEKALHEGLIEVEDGSEAILRLPDGMAIHMTAKGDGVPRMFPFMQLWSMADRPFFCVEPWMGHPNSMNSMGRVRWIPPGGIEKAVLKVWTA
jgi:galactose mutarotase-like enzyme